MAGGGSRRLMLPAVLDEAIETRLEWFAVSERLSTGYADGDGGARMFMLAVLEATDTRRGSRLASVRRSWILP